MAQLSDVDRNVFENLTKGVHDFDEAQLDRLHEAAQMVREVLKSVSDHHQRKMAAASFRQMG